MKGSGAPRRGQRVRGLVSYSSAPPFPSALELGARAFHTDHLKKTAVESALDAGGLRSLRIVVR